jgi:hypothetical protein
MNRKQEKESSPPRKRERTHVHFWQVGDEAEQLFTDPQYRDIFHPVRFVSINEKKNTASVQMLAFSTDNIAKEEDMNDFFPHRGPEPNLLYRVGDSVHFRMFGRRVAGIKVDGEVTEEGVWVKGIITDMNQEDGEFQIRHWDWSSKKPNATTHTWTQRRHMRGAQ